MTSDPGCFAKIPTRGKLVNVLTFTLSAEFVLPSDDIGHSITQNDHPACVSKENSVHDVPAPVCQASTPHDARAEGDIGIDVKYKENIGSSVNPPAEDSCQGQEGRVRQDQKG